jgi:hypothetical protein
MRSVLLCCLAALLGCGMVRRQEELAAGGAEWFRTPGGVTVRFVPTGASTYGIQWSVGPHWRNSASPMTANVDGERAQLWWESDKFVVLSQGCGEACWQAIVLPLDWTRQDQLILWPLDEDRARNLIAYLDGDGQSIVAENLETHATVVVPLAPLVPECARGFAGWCIDEVEFHRNLMRVRWCAGGVAGPSCPDELDIDASLAPLVPGEPESEGARPEASRGVDD